MNYRQNTVLFEIILGARLRQLRVEKKLSAEGAAKKIRGLSTATLTEMERANRRLSVSQLHQLCLLYEHGTSQLLAAVEKDMERCPLVWVRAELLATIDDPALAPLRECGRASRRLVRLDRPALQDVASQCQMGPADLLQRVLRLSGDVVATHDIWPQHLPRSPAHPAGSAASRRCQRLPGGDAACIT
ncbi:helix-turn-helix domain-containing protein [Saccharothrix sp. AJ9571]|nr:helix-turn-helix domain-containing protein [Saccharothrix sp. AJ9571]